jgi:hypothetical protein
MELWWAQYGQISLVIFGIVIGLITYIARGEGKELARLTIDLVLRLSSQGWDNVTEEQVKKLAGLVFDGARDFAGPSWLRVIPWRLFITRESVQSWAWAAWVASHRWFDSKLAEKTVEAAQASKVVPSGVSL